MCAAFVAILSAWGFIGIYIQSGSQKRIIQPLFLCLKETAYLSKIMRKFFSQWFRHKEGTTAIEFSLMAIPYVMLTVGIIELSIMYASASLLEGATSSAARLIRTGQLQQAPMGTPEELFRSAICDYATVLIRCSDIVVESQTMASFSDYDSMQPQYDADGNMVSQGFDPGTANERVLIRVSYRYNMMTPFIGPLLVGPSNSRLFMSTIVLQIEPYDDDATGA